MVVESTDITDGNRCVEVAACCLESQSFLRALTKNRQLHLAEGSLHAEQQPIVNLNGVVDSILVYDQAADQSAELQKRMPITAIAGKPRGFYRKNSAGPPSANSGQQSLESGPCNSAARTPEVIVDDDHVRPSQCPRTIRKSILTTTALRIICELVRRGLPHIDVSGAR